MFKKKISRVASLAVVIGLMCMCILPVSAAYVDMLDHGLYFGSAGALSTGVFLHDSGGAGTFEGTVKQWIPMWALDSYQPGSTYTFKFSCTVPEGLALSFENTSVLRYHAKQTSIKSSNTITGVYQSATYNPETHIVEFIVKLNTDITDLGGYPVYIYLYCPITSQVYSRMITNGWSTEVEKDEGGSDYIQSLIDEVATIRQNDETYHSNALEVLDGIKSGIDGMPGEIKDVLEQHDQQVKQEANTEGNDNINQATSALTNALPVASISDAIAPLVTACGYNGITSVWSFPAMKIPAIAGLFEEIQLNEVQNFDLCSYADQYIPDELLTLIRSITTVLLIVWAIREIMSLLSGMLGGGDSVGSG